MDPDSIQYTQMADDQLTGLARSGDQLAFSELIARTAPNSLKLAHSILKDREEAEDQSPGAAGHGTTPVQGRLCAQEPVGRPRWPPRGLRQNRSGGL